MQGYEFDRRKVSLSEPIKRLGEYSASVRLHPEVTATIKIVVDPEVSSKDGARQ
ncbi:MAG: 50S ribosomal L9 C-terminal domain-containing protein [Desulfomonilaceae bacterium]